MKQPVSIEIFLAVWIEVLNDKHMETKIFLRLLCCFSRLHAL